MLKGIPLALKQAKLWTFLLNDTEWHTWTLEWTQLALSFYVDGRFHFVYQNNGTGIQNGWPFDYSMNVILNFKLGIPGDTWSGRYGIDDSIFPTRHYVDYVRYYEFGNRKFIIFCLIENYLILVIKHF
jgi:hypothetical protein